MQSDRTLSMIGWNVSYFLVIALIRSNAYNLCDGYCPGTHSKSLVPGSDCPEGATFLNVSFLGEAMEEATTLERATCVFEHNTGIPLRRHMSYSRDQGAFYGGMADSVLTVRSILTIVNYDYIVDFIFHQVTRV